MPSTCPYQALSTQEPALCVCIFSSLILVIATGTLVDHGEELSGDVLCCKPELDSLIHPARSNESRIKPLDVICRQDQYSTLLRRYTIQGVEKDR